MDFAVKKLLDQATEKKPPWFERQETHRLEIWTYSDGHCEVTFKPLDIIDENGVKSDHLMDWLAQKEPYRIPKGGKDNPLIAGLRLLVQLNRPAHVIGEPDKLPWKDRETYYEVQKALKLPRFYVPVMDHSSGIAEVFATPQTSGSPRVLDFVAQNTNYNYDSWSLALSNAYDHQANINMTTGFFCADAKLNPASIIEHLKASKALAIHPMLLPAIMFQKLVKSSVAHRDTLRKDIQKIEVKLGYVKDRNDTEPDNPSVEIDSEDLEQLYDPAYLRYLSKELNTCKKQQASRDGRHGFWRQFREVILAAIEHLEVGFSDDQDENMFKASLELKHWTAGNGRIFESLEGRDINYRARIETQLNVLYNLFSQADGRLQTAIAEATRQDSADMKILAILGSIFLPINFVATMFNVNKFQLSGNPWTLFGIYLVFSSALTALVLVFAVVRPLWKRRTERRQKRRQSEEKRKILRKIWTEDLDGIALTSMGTNVDS